MTWINRLCWSLCWCLFSALPSQAATPDQSPEPLLVWPPTIEAGDIDPFEGIACFLAMSHSLTEPNRVIDIHQLRAHLNQVGLSITAPLSLASKLQTAADLGARELWVFTIHRDHYRRRRFDVASLQVLDDATTPRPDQWEQLPKNLADHLGLAHAEPRAYDFFRLWASVYFVDDLSRAGDLMARLTAHPDAKALFLKELTDLFGNPTETSDNVQEIVAWRDRFYEHGLFAAAEKSSLHLLEQRHNPDDLLDHARILLAQDKRDDACHYVRRAASFGFVRSNNDPLLKECQDH
ncbi:hypothetical protein [Acanthopleuribacter pedis]|uniref:Uncharacterized protein n=1 Tax=Acanthopleuribacter pedis TaxID=442870 RepID=A0A8J7U1M8_9BACT|nr:hypothetical protein [Acanthopleuribacter pedis]MBO1318363.1 hypothetical protein [Acanthopleuribacter pedis]